MSKEEMVTRFMNFVMGSSEDFYNTYLVNLSEQELQTFMENNPDFEVGQEFKNMKQENIKRESIK